MGYMDRLVVQLRKAPIHRRLRWNFLIIALVSIIAVGVVSAIVIYRSMESKAIAHSRNITGQIIRSVTFYLEDFTQRFDRAANNETVLADLQIYDTVPFTGQEQIENQIRLIFSSIFGNNRGIDTVELVTPIGTRLYFHSPITSGEPDSLLQNTLSDNGEIGWTVAQKETSLDDKTYILLSQRLHHKGKDAGALFVSLRRDYLDQACRNSATTGSGFIVIADSEGVVVSHPDTTQVGVRLQAPVLNHIAAGEINFRSGTELYVWERLPANGWIILNVLSYADLMRDTTRLLVIMALACVVLVSLAIIVSIQITGSIAEPINRLVQAMRGDNHLTPVATTGARDEYEELSLGFNRMIGRISTLIEDDYRAELKNRELKVVRSEAERSSLQQQINPHFLYNTLETIYWSSQLDGNDEISQMITALGNYFRSIINKGMEYVPVSQEISNVGNYLFLQNKRFSERIRLDWQVEDCCRSLFIIKLTFQPIVEDIISYSVERTDDPVEITISLTAGERLVASISGRSVQLLLTAPDAIRDGEKNVHQRLLLYFGEPCGIHEQLDEEGGRIMITMPLLHEIPEGGE